MTMSARMKMLHGEEKAKRIPVQPWVPTQEGDPAEYHFLSKRAREIWNREAPSFRESGKLRTCDAAAFADYCRTLAEIEELERDIAKQGRYQTSHNGCECSSAAVQQSQKTRAHLHKCIAQFGISPWSSSRVTAAAPEGEDEFDRIGRKPAKLPRR